MAFYKALSVDGIRAQLDIPRDRARNMGADTVEILLKGTYIAPSGKTVAIRDRVTAAQQSRVTYGPASSLPRSTGGTSPMTVDVRNKTTLAALREMQSKGLAPAILNMASATSPGGGFLNGARAQEEYLARSTALWA